jgi:hypothetical protein
MKAMLKAPSAKNLLNILGSENAIKKASAIGPAPKKAAIKISLKNPKTLEANVQLPTVDKAEISLIFLIIAPLS